MWSLRRTTTLQILVGACGVPLAWTKFVDRESTSEVVSFLSSAHSQLFVPPTPHSLKTSFPSYIAYDKACTILRSLLPDDATSSSGSFTLPTFLNTTRLVVTAFHRGCHPANDAFCDEFCDPAPLSGEGRHNLVVPFQRPKERGVMESKAERKKRKVRTFERAFNTTVSSFLFFSSLLFRRIDLGSAGCRAAQLDHLALRPSPIDNAGGQLRLPRERIVAA